MKILAIGDIVGRPGRETVKALLPAFKKKHKVNLVIANGENLSHGKGISEQTVHEMQAAGVDYFTTGNHVWANKEVLPKLDDPKFPVIRPANFPPGVPGRGYAILETKLLKKILIVNLLGRFMVPPFHLDCPFRTMERIFMDVVPQEKPHVILVDLHAEATSEKLAMAFFLEGKIAALWGTHTHVQTADARIFADSTAYITDLGMTGVRDCVIGVKREVAIHHFLTQLPFKYEIETKGETLMNGALLSIDTDTGKAKSIHTVSESYSV